MTKIRDGLRLLGLTIGLAILTYQGYIGITNLINSGHPPNLKLLAVPIIISVSATFLQVLAWFVIMKGLKVRVSLRDAIMGYVVNFLPRYIPGAVWGYLSRAEWLHKNYDLDFKTSNWGSIIEIVLGIDSCLIVIIVFFINSGSKYWGILLAVLFTLLLVPWFFISEISKVHSFRSIRNPLMGISIGLKEWGIAVAILSLNWMLYGVILGLCAYIYLPYAFVPDLSFILKVAALFGASWLIGFLAWVFPAGLGPRELLISQGMSMLFGISIGQASIIAVTVRLVMIFSELFWAVSGITANYIIEKTTYFRG